MDFHAVISAGAIVGLNYAADPAPGALPWLLAGVGIHLHVERLQHDRSYALRALDAASASASPAAQVLARRLRGRLDAAP